MNLKCPICHARFSIEQLTQDEAARALLGMRPTMLPSLMPYLALFRTGKRDLAFDKALNLVKEVMALEAPPQQLETALAATVESIKTKREEGQFQPLKNHNYLQKVLANTATGRMQCAPTVGAGGVRPVGKRMAAITALTDWAGSDWLRLAISAGLQGLVAQALPGQPAAEMITLNADIWFVALQKSCTIEAVDAIRIHKGFVRLFPQVTEWPAAKQLLALMPERPRRTQLREPEPSAEQHANGKQKLREMAESLK